MTRIYQLTRGFEVWCWLCSKCLKARKKAGWEVKTDKSPPYALECDDCKAKGN